MDNCIDIKYQGSISEIKSMTNTLLCIGYIDTIEGDEFIKFVSKNDDFPRIDYNTVVKISVMNTKLGCLFLMGTVYLSEENSLSIKDITVLSDVERRNFFRVKLTDYTTIYNRDNGEKLADGIFVDLSLSGFMVRTETELTKDRNYAIAITIKDIIYMFEFVVIREKEPNNGYFIYGCEFRNVDSKTQDILSAHIFSLQRKNISKVKNRF